MPKINIFYSEYLDPIFTEYSRVKYPDWTPPGKDFVMEKAKIYEDAWNHYQKDIFKHMKSFTGLSFKRKEINVYVVSGNPRVYSNPIILSSKYSIEEFLGVITHELLHCLFKDNKDIDLRKPYKKYNAHVQNHIITYATIEHIFKELKMPDVVLSEKKAKMPDYIEAWRVVSEIGYKNIGKKARKYSTK